ncbi:MAG: endonuclease III [Nitrospirae bacterium]|nr:MAG: endonuclease III [Nitrospirota bacterium]
MTRQTSKSSVAESPREQKQRVKKIIKLLDQTYPHVGLALNFSTPLELLIALILAAQCTDERVNQVTAQLFPRYRTAEDWAALDQNTLEHEIRAINFYRNKAKTIKACCQALLDQFGGQVPATVEDLVSLPGVGRKTANILLGNAFGQPAIGVDRHVARLAQRLGLTHETDPDRIEFDLQPLVPDDSKVRFCHLLQAHGRTICLARSPRCDICPIKDLCPYPANKR